MKPLILTYQGDGFNEEIEAELAKHPGFKGNVIAVPKGLEWLLEGSKKPLNKHEDELWPAKN